MSKRIVITGANRGIGFALTARWIESGAQVCALVRDRDGANRLGSLAAETDLLTLHRADVTDDASVDRAMGKVSERFDSIDVLVNNAGINPRDGSGRLDNFSFDDARDAFEVNTLGPIRVTRTFLPLLVRGDNPRVVHVTSKMGSIGLNLDGGAWPYRISKAALNMAHKNLALEVDGVTSVVVHPGWVRTDMGGPSAPLSVEDSAGAIVKIIDGLRPGDHGRFIDVDGTDLEW